MLDVHPPHTPTHTWRDFFIHIATIVIGLLIAIGLEQSVEFFHHRHQRNELREGAAADARQMLHDIDENRLAAKQQLEDLNARIEQVQEAIATHTKLAPPTYRPDLPTDAIRTANFEAAKQSGLLQLLSKGDITIFEEAQVGVARAETLRQLVNDRREKRIAFEQRFQRNHPDGPFDFSAATPSQLDQYLATLIDERVITEENLRYLDLFHRGTSAYLGGQRTVDSLRKAEVGH
jgi:hypothetical protein